MSEETKINPFKTTFWINVYKNGQISQTLCKTKAEALYRCTFTNNKPDAKQVAIKILRVDND